MLKRAQIIEQMKHLFLDIQEFRIYEWDITVGAGGALVMHGIRDETNDIDGSCNSKNFEILAKHFKAEIVTLEAVGLCPSVRKFHVPDTDIDIHEDLDYDNGTYVLTTAGISILPPHALIRQKLALGRDKDLVDLEKMREVWQYFFPTRETKLAEMLKPTISG